MYEVKVLRKHWIVNLLKMKLWKNLKNVHVTRYTRSAQQRLDKTAWMSLLGTELSEFFSVLYFDKHEDLP